MTLAATLVTALAATLLQAAPSPEPPPQPAPPEQARPPEDGEDENGDVAAVVVQGVRPRGSVIVDVEPELTLGEDDIKAIGGANIGEILQSLSSLTESTTGSGGPQIVLINGRRSTGGQEVNSIPREAIERLEILPEDVALAYGYPVDRKVTNFVLKQKFEQTSVRIEGTTPTQGGGERGKAGGNLFRLDKGDRWNLDIEVERQNALFETERNLDRDPGSRPFDRVGNITGLPYGAEIDPALSALAGAAVLTASVPRGNATPGLADFVPGAGAVRTDDLSAWRSLSSDIEGAKIEGSYAHDLDSKTLMTLSASLQDRSTTSYLGLPGISLVLPSTNPFSPFAEDVRLFRYIDAPNAMTRTSDTQTATAGVVFDGYLVGDWRWTLSGDYKRVESETRTGRGFGVTGLQAQLNAGTPGVNPFGDLTNAGIVRLADDTANSVNTTASVEMLISGELFELPAGPVRSVTTLGWDTRSLDAESVRSGARIDRSLSRDRAYGKFNLTADLIERDAGPIGGLGDLWANLQADYYDLSDFGGLFDYSGTLRWSPRKRFNISLTYERQHNAPDVAQLNDPVIATPNVPVFDFATGQTVFVTYVTGGNPGLKSDDRQAVRLNISLQPFEKRQMSLSLSYGQTKIEDSLSPFPAITPALEAALPGRFTRDGSGQLIALDARALNFARAERQDLRFNFLYILPFGKAAELRGGRPGGGPGGWPGGAGGRPGGMAGGPRGPRGGPGGGLGGGRGGFAQPGQGRAIFNVTYSRRIKDEIEVRPGLPVINQLESSRQPRDSIDAGVRVSKGGNGANLQVRWNGEGQIRGGAGGVDLTFEPYATANVELFTEVADWPVFKGKPPVWLKGAQIQLNVSNLFDERQDVVSSTGVRPLNYQPDYMDPNGRTVTLRLRKILF